MKKNPTRTVSGQHLLFIALVVLLSTTGRAYATCELEDNGEVINPTLMERGKGFFTLHQKQLTLVTCDVNIGLLGHMVVALKPGGCFFNKSPEGPTLFECAPAPKKTYTYSAKQTAIKEPKEKAPGCQLDLADETVYPIALERGKGQAIGADPKYPILLTCNQAGIAAPGYRVLKLLPGSCQAFVEGNKAVLFECQ